MIVGIPRETFPGERRVAMVPSLVASLKSLGCELLVEAGAGESAGYPDSEFADKGASLVNDRAEIFRRADVVLQVRTPGANTERGSADIDMLRQGQLLIGFSEPLTEAATLEKIAQRGCTLFAAEMVPRITRAQSMDALSSMATIAGYKAALIAANELPQIFPLLMTAAGTLAPANVFVIGAGVAGLQAIATTRRLGAVVSAYDLRPAVKEQVQSLGAKFVEMELEAGASEDKGGYAKQMDEEFYRKQRELMTGVCAHSNVVITTAAIPGRKAPILITEEMVKAMPPGSVIVDLAAERGGNCELTRPGEKIVAHGVTIIGPLNIPTEIPFHASQMYAKNMTNLLKLMIKEGKLELDLEDEVIKETMVCKDGALTNPRVQEALSKSRGAASQGGQG